MSVDLSNGYVRSELSKRILREIDDYALRAYDEGARSHLGASLIGQECLRQAYYSFRWFISGGAFDGRMQRLFQRGHLEELRFMEYLRGIGCEVWDKDTNGKQFRCLSINGHFGGSLDAVIKLPDSYGITDEVVFLGEFKTKATGSGFDKLKELGIRVTNPTHYGQMCVYGRTYGFKYSLYFTVNKNNDDLHIEIVPLDWSQADLLLRKGDYVINTRVPPARVSMSPAYKTCKWCNFTAHCHGGKIPDKNCRSCTKSVPVEDSRWQCEYHNALIPVDVIKVGCDAWTPIQ